jgi:hypothetical protein
LGEGWGVGEQRELIAWPPTISGLPGGSKWAAAAAARRFMDCAASGACLAGGGVEGSSWLIITDSVRR